MGLYTLPVHNSSKKNSYKKPWGRWVSTSFQQTIHLKIKQLSKSLGKMGLSTLSADNSSKNKTIMKIPGEDGSLHQSSRQFI